jgi:hypothetical protein
MIKINHNFIRNSQIFFILYLSLLLGFYFNENTTGGAFQDYKMRLSIIYEFQKDFLNAFLNYDKFPDRHSPLLYIFISILNILGIDLNLIRLLHTLIAPITILIIYKCLALKFVDHEKNILFLISCVFFFSPTIRSLAIWPDARLLGFLFFTLSTFYFFNFQKSKKYQYCLLNNFFLIVSAYFSPNFSIFFLYFFYYFINYYRSFSKLLILIVFNTILSLPMLYYIFALDVNFLAINAVNNINFLDRINVSNKILIISTLIMFYLMPLILNNNELKKIYLNNKIKNLVISGIIFLILIKFFSYSIEYTGGGIFFKLSFYLFNNNILFLFISLISILTILNYFRLNFNNILLFVILVISNPQLTIYHKYYDPLLLFLFFLFFDFKQPFNKLINTGLIKKIYIFYICFLSLSFMRGLIL